MNYIQPHVERAVQALCDIQVSINLLYGIFLIPKRTIPQKEVLHNPSCITTSSHFNDKIVLHYADGYNKRNLRFKKSYL